MLIILRWDHSLRIRKGWRISFEGLLVFGIHSDGQGTLGWESRST